MDAAANLKEQIELANEIMQIWDECPEDGDFTDEQLDDLADKGIRLAELVQALHDWMGRGGFIGEGMS